MLPTHVAALLKAIFDALQFRRNRDHELHDAFRDVLTAVGADGFFSRLGTDWTSLAVFQPIPIMGQQYKNDLCQRIIWYVDNKHRMSEGFIVEKCDDLHLDAIFYFPQSDYRTERGRPLIPPQKEFLIFFRVINNMRKKLIFVDHIWEQNIMEFAGQRLIDHQRIGGFLCVCLAIKLAVLTRSEGDAVFSAETSADFWHRVDNGVQRGKRIRPWDDENGAALARLMTVTISLDLRSSTIQMSQAVKPKEYADWIEGLVLVLRQIVHDNHGVFDKFTGDGVMAHFPGTDLSGDSDPDEDEIVRRSVACAWEMIRAAEICLDRLLRNLSMYKRGLGPAIGLALDEAQWSVDRMGNSIVVGRGVVYACRCSNGPAGTIYVNNAAYRRLGEAYEKGDIEEIPFISKEFAEHDGMRIYWLKVPPRGLTRDDSKIRSICDAVYDDMRARGGKGSRGAFSGRARV